MRSSKIFAADLDGTLTPGGEAPIEKSVRKALQSLRSEGWTLILATGRDRPYLLTRPDLKGLFDAWIMEAGLSIYIPSTNYYSSYASEEWVKFIKYLKRLDFVEPKENTISVKLEFIEALKKIIVDWEARAELRDNKGNVILLPLGINKAFALRKTMEIMNLDGFIVAVGDSEVDLELMETANFSAAVANADETVKAKADYVAREENGKGVIEIIQLLQKRKDIAESAGGGI